MYGTYSCMHCVAKIFIQENAFENVIWEKASILSQPQCVNWLRNFAYKPEPLEKGSSC